MSKASEEGSSLAPGLKPLRFWSDYGGKNSRLWSSLLLTDGSGPSVGVSRAIAEGLYLRSNLNLEAWTSFNRLRVQTDKWGSGEVGLNVFGGLTRTAPTLAAGFIDWTFPLQYPAADSSFAQVLVARLNKAPWSGVPYWSLDVKSQIMDRVTVVSSVGANPGKRMDQIAIRQAQLPLAYEVRHAATVAIGPCWSVGGEFKMIPGGCCDFIRDYNVGLDYLAPPDTLFRMAPYGFGVQTERRTQIVKAHVWSNFLNFKHGIIKTRTGLFYKYDRTLETSVSGIACTTQISKIAQTKTAVDTQGKATLRANVDCLGARFHLGAQTNLKEQTPTKISIGITYGDF